MKEIKRFRISRSRFEGFTLIELLIVIGIIAILAAATFVALNPLQRFQDSRDARRRADLSAILSAVKVNQVDNGGKYLASIADDLTFLDGETRMIGTSASGCDSVGIACGDVTITETSCVDLTGLKTDGYLGDVPIAPTAVTSYSAAKTGYTLTKGNIITVQACDSENATEIKLAR